MKLGLRIFLGYFLVVGLSLFFLLNVFVKELKPGVRQATEETLVDTANLLAELATDEVKSGTIGSGHWRDAVDRYGQRRLEAHINGFVKSAVHYRVYVTDRHGIVLYDSDGKDVGADYSRWNDVYLTLHGKYGARSTHSDPHDELSSVMHVAAPIMDGDQIIGVVTVAKPNLSVQPFIEAGRAHLIRAGILLMILSLLIGLGFTWWLSRAVRRVVEYAHDLSQGKRVRQPRLAGELSELGHAVTQLRAQLDGKSYVEQYVHALTHELKSPIAAIAGAAELLGEDMPPAEHARFCGNIAAECLRMQTVIDRLLDLARVEQRQALEKREPVPLRALVSDLCAAKEPLLRASAVSLDNQLGDGAVLGDPFLLRQALQNLIDNAIAFTPAGGQIRINDWRENGRCHIAIHNTGSEIPDYARGKIFDRFYSLPRPRTQQKSTGIGLSFVKEVALLHDGDVRVENADGGVTATLSLPLA
jgi:two-component system, OmpR family, sensor histidine kinase CreC